MDQTTDGKPHKCTYCKERFKVLYQKQNHEKTHLCSVCGKCFPLSWIRRSHEKTHENDDPYQRQKHELTRSTGNGNFNCSYCKKVCVSLVNKARHERLMHGGTVKPVYKCSYCRKKFSLFYNKRRHEKVVHQKTRVSIDCEDLNTGSSDHVAMATQNKQTKQPQVEESHAESKPTQEDNMIKTMSNKNDQLQENKPKEKISKKHPKRHKKFNTKNKEDTIQQKREDNTKHKQGTFHQKREDKKIKERKALHDYFNQLLERMKRNVIDIDGATQAKPVVSHEQKNAKKVITSQAARTTFRPRKFPDSPI